MNVPSRKECMELLKKYNVPDNIIKHSVFVSKIAVHIAKELKRAKKDIDIDLVEAGALLHDIAKYRSILENNEYLHGDMAENILVKEGYPEVGRVAKMHRLDRAKELKTWEEKVVYYADKRVLHRKIVSLKERYNDLKKRYKVPKDRRYPLEPVLEVERDIFNAIGESPEQLKEAIENAD